MWEILMRSMMVPTAVAALAAVVLTLPVQAASSHKRYSQSVRAASYYGAVTTRPYYSSETTAGTPAIYRFNHYQGTDPDPQVRLELLRDGRNYGH
jgi:hypothetical protein